MDSKGIERILNVKEVGSGQGPTNVTKVECEQELQIELLPPAGQVDVAPSTELLPPADQVDVAPSTELLPPAGQVDVAPSTELLPSAGQVDVALNTELLPPAGQVDVAPSTELLPPAGQVDVAPNIETRMHPISTDWQEAILAARIVLDNTQDFGSPVLGIDLRRLTQTDRETIVALLPLVFSMVEGDFDIFVSGALMSISSMTNRRTSSAAIAIQWLVSTITGLVVIPFQPWMGPRDSYRRGGSGGGPDGSGGGGAAGSGGATSSIFLFPT